MKVAVENVTLSLQRRIDDFIKTTPQPQRTAPKKSQEMILIEQINILLLRLTQDVSVWRKRFSEFEPRIAVIESLLKNDEPISNSG